MNRFFLAITMVLLVAATASAQDRVKIEQRQSGAQVDPNQTVYTNRVFMAREPGPMALAQTWERLPEGKIEFFSADIAGNGEPVKDAPYTATAVTESTQTLADGNRIVNKSSVFVARDSQGRTRREQTIDRLGPLSMEGSKVVFISDPAAHTDYILNPDEQRARIVKRDNMKVFTLDGADKTKHEITARVKLSPAEAEHARTTWQESSKQVKREQLGTQVMDGVTVEGTRETVTIAAGQIGNDRPIEIVSENWYSQDLHALVLHKHSDPRFGYTVFHLTDIKRGEPDASLFQVPAGFKSTTVNEPTVELRRRETPKE